jgi:RHS repeat-associated protein
MVLRGAASHDPALAEIIGVRLLLTAWGYQYTYDAYGNLSVMHPTQGTPPSLNITVSGSTNQVTTSPYAYDASGDMTNDNSQTFTYDAEGRISTMGGTALGFNYNAFGEYVSFTENGTVAGGVPYDLDGHNLGLYTAADDNWTDYYVYMDGRQIAWLAQVNESFTHFIHTNNIGSSAQVTDQNGNLVYDMVYYPFGMQWTGSGSYGDTLFGGMEPYNWGMGLNEALKRWQVPPLGRWLTPDPVGKGAVHLDDPQTWNAYGYVRNNPTALTDPEGTSYEVCGINGLDCSVLSNEQFSQWSRENNITIGAGGELITSDPSGNRITIGSESYSEDALQEFIQDVNRLHPGDFLLAAVGTGAVGGTVAGGVLAAYTAGAGLTTLTISAATAGPLVTDPDAQRLVDWLFQESDRLPGGTAGAVRYELINNDTVGGQSHVEKAENAIKWAQRLLKSGNLSFNDQTKLRGMIQELRDALATRAGH